MSVSDAYARLSGAIAGTVGAQERMARHTSLRTGGPASLFLTCDTYGSLRLATDVLHEEGIPWVIMGRGCSVIASDEGYDGAVITLGREFRRFLFDDERRMHVGAGTMLQRVVQEAFTRDLRGLEFAVGIPGTLGGAVSMNATDGVRYLGQLVDEVVTFRPGEGLVRYAGNEIGWYRSCSDIPPREIVLEATLQLAAGTTDEAKRAMEGALARRHERSPLGKVTAGAIFADPGEACPDGVVRTAGELIELCGCAGLTQGRAQVSPHGANHIVNLGGATSADVARLIVTVLSKVRQGYGIELRPEIKFLGFPS